MSARPTYTTTWVRADTLTMGDVAKIWGKWVHIHDAYDSNDGDAVADEFGADEETRHKILSIIDPGTLAFGGVYVAVRYLSTSIDGGFVREPRYQVTPYTMYSLIEIQVMEDGK